MILNTPYNLIMDSVYKRLRQGLHFDVQLKPYTQDFLIKVLDYFSKEEEYEKCIFLDTFIKEKFSHNKNYN